MAETKIYSYMLNLLVGGKIIKGLVTSGLQIKPNFEELILKEDEGVAQKEIKDSELELPFSGKTIERDILEILTHEDFETLRAASLAGTEIVFSYGSHDTGRITVGSGRLTSFGETAGSEKVLGDFSGTLSAKNSSIADAAEIIDRWRDYMCLIWTGVVAGNYLVDDLESRLIQITNKDFTGIVIPGTSSATLSLPEEADLILNDVDHLWFNNGSAKEVSVADLIGNDYFTVVKYRSSEPYDISAFGILKQGVTLTQEQIDQLHTDFELWMFWTGIFNDYGYLKDNATMRIGVGIRAGMPISGGSQTTTETPTTTLALPDIPQNLAVTYPANGDVAHITFDDQTGGTAQHEIHAAIGAGDYVLVTTLAEGVESYDDRTWMGVTMNYKIRALRDGSYSDYTSPASVATPLVFKVDMTTPSAISFSAFAISVPTTPSITINWGDGASNSYKQGDTVDHTYTVPANPYYVQIGGTLGNITDINLNSNTKVYGVLDKWILPTNLVTLRFYYNKLTGDLSTFEINAKLTKLNLASAGASSNQITAPPRGNLLGLDSSDGIYMPTNACNTAALDAWLAWANNFYASNTPTKNVYFDFSGASMGIPTGGNSNTDIVGIKSKFTAAGKTATITVRTS